MKGVAVACRDDHVIRHDRRMGLATGRHEGSGGSADEGGLAMSGW
jgi:hypothetical protein